MNEPYHDVVTTFPPEKSPEGDAVILKFHASFRPEAVKCFASGCPTRLRAIPGRSCFCYLRPRVAVDHWQCLLTGSPTVLA